MSWLEKICSNMKRVAIDVGHARRTGAAGYGLQEHECCVRIAEALRGWLDVAGVAAEVVDFPQLSNSADLVATVNAVNAGDFDLCVSLHCDCADNELARGAHVCYVSSAGSRAARAIAAEVCVLSPGRANKTVQRADLYVLRKTKCPAVLVECGFLSNAHDAYVLRHGADKLAAAIGRGVVAFLG